MRSIAQKRLTAVGRVRVSVSQMVSTCASRSASLACCTPIATPIAAATPIAGAPRMIMSLIAVATSWYVRQVTYSSCKGRRVWSIMTTPSLVHSIVSTMCWANPSDYSIGQTTALGADGRIEGREPAFHGFYGEREPQGRAGALRDQQFLREQRRRDVARR